MKKTKVINSDLSRVIATMGHFDKLSVRSASNWDGNCLRCLRTVLSFSR